MKPILSIIIPSYNQAEFLEFNLEVLANNKIDEYEVLVADGGSSDDSVKVIEKYSNYIKWYVSEKDRGQSHALNKALAETSGTWIGWQNSDDKYHPNAISEFLDILHKDKLQNKNYDVYFANIDVIDENNNFVYKKYYTSFSINELKYLGYNVTNQAMFIRKELLVKCGAWDEQYHFAMDADLLFRLYNNNARFKFCNREWGSFRVHSLSKSSTQEIVRNKEWKLLAEREFLSSAHLHPYSGTLHIRKILVWIRRLVLLTRDGNLVKLLKSKKFSKK